MAVKELSPRLLLYTSRTGRLSTEWNGGSKIVPHRGTEHQPQGVRVWHLAAVGLSAGLLSGLLGVGGGVIIVTLLVLWMRSEQRTAHAVSLTAIIPISIAGIAAYGSAGAVHPAEAVALAVGSVVGARVGAGALARVDEGRLKLVFGLFLIAIALSVVVRS